MPRPPDARALRVIETIYRLFAARGSWPLFTELDRYLDMHGQPDAEAALIALPPGLTYGVGTPPLRDDQEIALTIAGLSACVDRPRISTPSCGSLNSPLTSSKNNHPVSRDLS